MSKYRRWERVEKPEPAWLVDRQAERAHTVRAGLVSGLSCEECAEPVSQGHFLSYGGLCARCWEMLHTALLDGGSALPVVAVVEEVSYAGVS